MSVPEHDEDEHLCELHGMEQPCWRCRQRDDDLYADWKYQDSVDGR